MHEPAVRKGTIAARGGPSIARGNFVNPSLPHEAAELVVALANSPRGILAAPSTLAGRRIFVDNAVLSKEVAGRGEAAYRHIIDEFLRVGVLERGDTDIYHLTLTGYQCADALTSGDS